MPFTCLANTHYHLPWLPLVQTKALFHVKNVGENTIRIQTQLRKGMGSDFGFSPAKSEIPPNSEQAMYATHTLSLSYTH
jgi:hypothetical protein